MIKGVYQFYSEEAKQFIFDNYKNFKKTVMLKLLEEKFGEVHTYGSIKSFYTKYNLKNGFDCKFYKGQKSWIEGKHHSPEALKKMEKTMFKKGNKPWNTKQVGERVFVKEIEKNRKGYWIIKIADPNSWMLLHHYNWEKVNGPVPKGYRLIFLDGNTDNCDVSNLRLVTGEEHLIINKTAYPNCSVEQRNIFIDLAKLEVKIRGINEK